MRYITEVGKSITSELTGINSFECYLAFYSAMVAFDQAESCFKNKEYEATAVMCRAAIDCAIYEALSRGENAIEPEFISEVGLSDGSIISVVISTKLNHAEWNKLKESVKNSKIKILTENECDEIKEKIRDRGDFEAHAAQLRDRFMKEGTKARFEIAPLEAEESFNLTRNYILHIIRRFFKVESK